MLKEINFFGIYFAPFALYFVIAMALFLPIRWLLDRYEAERWVWHRPLFDLSIFVILISLIGLMF
jgi:hypothetical protein